ncbi:hypothetical protein, partial [Actinomadura fibrosa]
MSGHVLQEPDQDSGASGGMVGLARMVMLPLDGHGRVLAWGEDAERLFGHAAETMLGRVFGDRFSVPGMHGAALDPVRSGAAEATAFTAPLLRRHPLKIKNVAWWVYRLPGGRPPPRDANGDGHGGGGDEHGGHGDGRDDGHDDERGGGRDDGHGGGDGHDGDGELRLLAFATETTSLRSVPLGLSVGDQIVARSAVAAEPHRGLRVPSVAPYLLPVTPPHLPRLRRNLAKVLGGLELPVPADPAALTARILDLGYPAVSFILGARLPFDAFDGLAIDDSALSAGGTPDGLAFLSRASAGIGSRLDPFRTAEELAGVVVPHLADVAEVHVLDDLLADPEGTVGQAPGQADRPRIVRRLARCGGTAPDPGPPDQAPVRL